MTDYPEHAKLKAVSDKSQIIGEFLDWLTNERGLTLAYWAGDELYPAREATDRLLTDYFGINLHELEIESRMMMDKIRADK